MDDDCDLVIDLDDEREETPQGSNNRNEEMRPIIYINNNNENNTMKQHSHKELQETRVIKSQNSNHNSDDDYIQVIYDDIDDDYEKSVQKLISAANKIGREYLNNKQLKEATANKILNDGLMYKSDSINGAITKQVPDHRTLQKLGLGKNQDSMCDSRNQVFSCVTENRIAETTSYKPSYESQYVMEDIPHHRNGNTFRRMDGYMQDVRTLPDIQHARHAYRYYDTERPEVDSSIGYHYPIMDRYEYRHTHRPEIPLRNDLYPHDPINTYFHVQRPTLNTNCRYNAMPRDTHNHYLPEDMLSIDEYRRAEMNRAPQFYSHRPNLIRIDDYRNTAIETDAYSYAYRPHEPLTRDYGNTINNGFPYSHYISDHALDDYWQGMVSRHAYRPEGAISMEDYERSLRYWHAYGNAYKPPVGLSLDPYRSVELPHIYRPDIVNMDTCREPMLTRNASYPETSDMYYHRQQISLYRTEIDDANRNDDYTLNLSRKQETTSTAVNTPRNVRYDKNKLRTILSTGNQTSKAPLNTNKRFKESGNLDLPVYKYKNSLNRTMEEHIKSNKTTLSVNKPESEHMDICKSEVPVITNRPDTVILSTKNVYQKSTHNQIAQSDDLAASEIIRENSHKIETTAKEIENHGAALDKKAKQFTHDVNKTHEEKRVDRETINAGEKDITVQLLVVFFTRVKELVKDTFPEFSKSLEKEIGNLGKRTNSGRLKTDIQYICPLYCSVSTYSLPRFDNTDDDNRIEKHVNGAKICDVCSCIQNCYKLYKKKYFNLVSTQSASKKQENDAKKGNETIKVNLPIESARGNRAQTVICRRQGTVCKEIGISESRRNVEINEELQRNQRQENTHSIISNKDRYGADTSTVIDKDPIASLHDKKLLDSLSVLNFSLPSKNIKKGMNSLNWVPTIVRFF